MRLFHYTSAQHMLHILEAQNLKTVESNVSLKREHAGPDVVWLTSKEEIGAGSGLASEHHDKTEWRFTVEVDKRSVHKWVDWAKRQGSSPETVEALIKGANGGHRAFYVTQQAIPSEQWLEIRNMHTGELLQA